ncbi:MAG: hypothetical protein JNG84_02180 [Archangium sp.]|nr:hypothetical protein [Archangium sp.]
MLPDDLGRRARDAAQQVDVEWADARSQAVELGVQRARRRRAVVRRGAAFALALCVVVGATWWLRSSRVDPRRALDVGGVAKVEVRPVTAVEPLDAATRYENGSLVAGRIRIRAGDEVVQVKAGVVEVELHRSVVLMERADAVYVHVDEGEAVVRWPGGVARLSAGGEGWYPPHATVESAARVAPEEEEEGPAGGRKAPAKVTGPAVVSPKGVAGKTAPVRATPSWKRLAEEGDFGAAYDALHQAPASVRDEPAELLLAADVARLSRHPAEAVATLRKMLDRHARDARAPLAAFTLGRVLLDELGQPTEADDAFALARSLSPTGPLADDALAREVEARSRGGDMSTARQLAEAYLQRLPNGPRARLVRHYGGLD